MTSTARSGRSPKSDAQAATALGTARGQDTAAAHRLHACAESVSALALDHAGLVCAFHEFGSSVGVGGNGVAAKGAANLLPRVEVCQHIIVLTDCK